LETGLGVAVEAYRTFGLTSWTYATTDPLGSMMEPGYFGSQPRRM
jgi:hypothetical protein